MRRKHEDFHDGAQDGLTPLEPLDIKSIRDFDELLRAMGKTAFGGRSLGEAAEVLTIMETLSRRGPIIGLDLVELAPIPGQQVSEFTAARLLYKALGYIYHARLK